MTSLSTRRRWSGKPAIGFRRKLLFSVVVTAGMIAMLESVLALVGVTPEFYTADPYVGFSSWSPLFRRQTFADGTAGYRTARNKLNLFNDQSFSDPKPQGTIRIFCLGGSTTMGRPYDDATSFPGWLREFAAAAGSDRKYEVINAGGVSYASYRVARLMEELVEYDPDLFIVYTGHNEFLESRTYREIRATPAVVRNLSTILSRTRIYSAMRGLSRESTDRNTHQPENGTTLSSDIDAILDRTVGPQSYHRDDQFQQNVFAHFQHSLHRIVDIAESVDAPVLFVMPASNLKDCSPFKSEHRQGLSPRDSQQVQRLLAEARQAQRSNDSNTALSLLDQAIQIDDRFADLYFLKGSVLWKQGSSLRAKSEFVRARDEDVCPLRAVTSIQSALQHVANARGARLVHFETALESKAAGGVPGAESFLDHVHPTIEGNRLLGQMLVDELIEMDLIHPGTSWNQKTRDSIARRVEASLNRQDHALALRKLSQVLGWAGKFDDADRLAIQAVTDLPDDAETHYLAGLAYERRDDRDMAATHFRQATLCDAKHWRAYYNLGNYDLVDGQFQSAVENFEQSIRVNPGFAKAHQNLGAAYLSLGEMPQALECIQRALQADPNLFEAHLTISHIYHQQGRRADAARHLTYAATLRPGDPRVQQAGK